MAIRISGMTSGLDTEAIVSAMVSGYKAKKDKLVKAQTKLSWKQDAYKAANTKVYNLYTSISSMRYTSAYALKKTTVSDATKATVSASTSAINGSQSLKINKLAKAGYLTGAQLGPDTTGSTKLSEVLHYNKAADGTRTLSDDTYTGGTGRITVTTGGKSTEISVDGNTTVDEFVQKLKDAGLKANYDSNNRRIFISSADSGVENDFTLTGANADGIAALSAFGVYQGSATGTAEASKYATIATEDVSSITAKIQGVAENYKTVSDKTAENTALKAKMDYAKAYQSVQEVENSANAAQLQQLKDFMEVSNPDSKYVAGLAVYTGREEVTDADGNVTGYKYYNESTDENGDTVKNYYNNGAVVDKEDALQTVSEKINSLAKDLGLITETTTTDDDGNEVTTTDDSKFIAYKANRATISAYEAEEDNAEAVAEVKGSADLATYITEMESTYSANETDIKTANAAIKADALYDVNKGSYDLDTDDYTALAEALKTKAQTAVADNSGYYNSDAVRVNGEDSEIELNGAIFTSASNNYSINGLSITATGVTEGEGITITTATDVDGIYDKVKDFLTQYNEVVNYLQAQYNADSAKGYDPLTDEEKSEMTDKQVEKWEQKVKDALLRRDSTIGNIMNVMSNAMAKSYEINGKKYSLSNFGINTLGYLYASANERNAYHIDGDADDSYTSANKDKLKAAIAEDPDTVIELLKDVTDGLYKSLDKQMKSSSLRSAYTIYNDKEMKSEYSDYTKTIKTWETRITEMENRYYKQFAAMEKALSNMQANSSSLTGLLGQ